MFKGTVYSLEKYFCCGENEKIVSYIDGNEHPIRKEQCFYLGPESHQKITGAATLGDACQPTSVIKN